MLIAMAEDGLDGGVVVAEVDLMAIWDVISQIVIGQDGLAYVVDANGQLIAHPDLSLVLAKTDLSALPQVAALSADVQPPGSNPDGSRVASDVRGRRVLTSHQTIESLGWSVFVEQPLDEVEAPLYWTLWRTVLLLLVGLLISSLASLFLARSMVRPIRALQAGVARIGAGALDQRVEVRTGDELEVLADAFNQMNAQLRESYANLEQKVEARTRDLMQLWSSRRPPPRFCGQSRPHRPTCSRSWTPWLKARPGAVRRTTPRFCASMALTCVLSPRTARCNRCSSRKS
jgi:methyl-accepting chemotaxis protein